MHGKGVFDSLARYEINEHSGHRWLVLADWAKSLQPLAQETTRHTLLSFSYAFQGLAITQNPPGVV